MDTLELIKCERFTQSPFHIHASESCLLIYVPQFKLALGESKIGFGKKTLFINNSDYIINEIGMIHNTAKTTIKYENTTIKVIEIFQGDRNKVVNLIEKLNLIKQYTEETEQEYNSLING